MADLDEVYAERNAVVLAFAVAMRELGWPIGKITDPTEPDWPVLMIETPRGQVSWHFKADDMPSWVPEHPHEWDGHSTDEKYRRLARWSDVDALTNDAPPSSEEGERSMSSQQSSRGDGPDKQMLDVAGQVADFAYRQGVGEAVAVDHLIQKYRAFRAEIDQLRVALTAAQRNAAEQGERKATGWNEVYRLRAALESVCNVGDRAAVLTAREALAKTTRDQARERRAAR